MWRWAACDSFLQAAIMNNRSHQVNPTLLDEPATALSTREGGQLATGQATSFADMLAAAFERGEDPAKLGELIALVNAERARIAESAFTSAMRDAQAAMPCIVRDGVNPFLKTRYAKLETVNSIVKPVAAAHGFSLSFSEADSPRGADWVRVVCSVRHVGGHTERHHHDLPIDGVGMKGGQNKSGPQALGATLSYARRYLITHIFNLTIADEDLDGAAAESLDCISERDAVEVENLVAEKGANLARFLEWAGVASVRDIKARDLPKVLKTLNAKKGPNDGR